MGPTIEDVVSDERLDLAYAWLCRRRKRFPSQCDVWSLRRQWDGLRPRLKAEVIEGCYRFGLLSRVRLQSGEEVDVWSARDAIVLKCLALALVEPLGISRHCCHLKGNGGSKGAIRDVFAELGRHRFVLKTDIRFYYASVDHDRLIDRLERRIDDPKVLALLGQYLRRTVERGGLYWHSTRGIALGCSPSPLMGAFFLTELDAELERQRLFFRRYMDDVIVLAPTRWKLRRAVAAVNRTLAALKLDKHPDKTFIGRIEKGFDFLGYHFTPGGLTVSEKTARAFADRVFRLYERQPRVPARQSAPAPVTNDVPMSRRSIRS